MRARHLLTLTVSLVATAASAAAASAAEPGPLTPPASDPFYTAPAPVPGAPNGTVLRARQVTPTALSVPLPARGWQLLYASRDNRGAVTADVTTVMVPDTPWTGPGARPVVSYQTAEDSVGSQCAPSYAIRAGLPAATSNAAGEVMFMETLLLKGWAVVTSDYEGPASAFLAGRQSGHAVLDGIRAALAYGPDTLSPRSRVALWGYSGGAFASSWAAELQPAYAPALRLAGVALGGDPADLVRSFKSVDGSYGAGLVFGGIIGLERAFPHAGIEQMFTAAGEAALAAGASDCTDELLARYPFAHVASDTRTPHPYDGTALSRVLVLDSPLGQGAPRVGTPVYDYHATGDELVPVAVGDDLVARYCAAGVPVEKVRYSAGNHNSTLVTGSTGAEQFLADRFAGAAAVNSCPPLAARFTPSRRSRSRRHTPSAHRRGHARRRGSRRSPRHCGRPSRCRRAPAPLRSGRAAR